MSSSSGVSLIGLLGGLLDTESSSELATAIREVVAFAKESHRYVVTINVSHNPRREGDK